MRRLLQLFGATLLAISMTGCVIIDGDVEGRESWRELQRDNREAISRLEIGATRADVIRRLGTPSDSEAFTRGDGEELRVLFYRTQHKHSDGETTRDETTPLVFEGDLLIGWGDAVYRELRP